VAFSAAWPGRAPVPRAAVLDAHGRRGWEGADSWVESLELSAFGVSPSAALPRPRPARDARSSVASDTGDEPAPPPVPAAPPPALSEEATAEDEAATKAVLRRFAGPLQAVFLFAAWRAIGSSNTAADWGAPLLPGTSFRNLIADVKGTTERVKANEVDAAFAAAASGEGLNAADADAALSLRGFAAALCHVAAARGAAGEAGEAVEAPTAPASAPLATALERLLRRHVCADGATRLARAVQAATPDGAGGDVDTTMARRANALTALHRALRRTRAPGPRSPGSGGPGLRLGCLVAALRGAGIAGPGAAPDAASGPVPLLPLACAALGALQGAAGADVAAYKAVPLPLALPPAAFRAVLLALAGARAARPRGAPLHEALDDVTGELCKAARLPDTGKRPKEVLVAPPPPPPPAAEAEAAAPADAAPADAPAPQA
jgi:hypothetical protein